MDWKSETFFLRKQNRGFFFQNLVGILDLFKFDMLCIKKYFSNVSIHEENQTFNMNVPLNYNIF
jgi:hypothetical protein